MPSPDSQCNFHEQGIHLFVCLFWCCFLGVRLSAHWPGTGWNWSGYGLELVWKWTHQNVRDCSVAKYLWRVSGEQLHHQHVLVLGPLRGLLSFVAKKYRQNRAEANRTNSMTPITSLTPHHSPCSNSASVRQKPSRNRCSHLCTKRSTRLWAAWCGHGEEWMDIGDES